MLRDIVERPTSSTSARPPSTPSRHSNGFPSAQHRSQKQSKATSSFSRARKHETDHDNGVRVLGTGQPVQAVPAVQAVSSRSAELLESEPVRDASTGFEEASEANWRLVRDMGDAQREEEKRELEKRFGGDTMKALRTRAMGRSKPTTNADSAFPSEQSTSEYYHRDKASAHQSTVPLSSTSQSLSSHADTPELIPSSSALKERYFADVPTESRKLEWLQPPTASCSTDTSVRFNLTGTTLSQADKTDLPSNLGLHHHGTAPDLAGYTLQDVLHLARSTIPSQRITMLGVLAKIISTYEFDVVTDTSNNVEARTASKDAKAREKGIELGIEILLSPFRSLGVVRAGIDLLFEALGGSAWWWLDEELATYSFRQDPNGIDNLPFETLIPRLSQILSYTSGFQPRSIQQIIRILRRAAQHSMQLAETVCPLVSVVVQHHVLRKPWPLEANNEPSIDGLRLLGDIVISSRTCALSLAREDLYQGLLKFAIPSTWTSETECQALALEVLQIYREIGRYGFLASIATSAREIWRDLGSWASRQIAPDPLASSVTAAYFDCLAMWMTCAIDPHRTTPEHDLTWSQISGLGWADEAISKVKQIGMQRGRTRELSSAMRLLVVWVDGTGLNGLRGGDAEKNAVINGFHQTEMKIHQYVDAISGGAENEAILNLLTIAIQLQRSLLPATGAQGLLFEPEAIQDLISRFLVDPENVKATTSRQTTQIRYELLYLSRASDLIDVNAWSRQAFGLMPDFGPGDEILALDLIDQLLREDWASTAPDLLNQLSSLTQRDGLQVLRPLLHYAILPDVSHVIGPSFPAHSYLKATSTLRQPVEQSRPGLPLSPDWVFSPLNELLSSATSPAFQQAPLDWNPSELDIVRATLILAQLSHPPLDRSSILLNLMKIFMLEHGQQSALTSDSDIFRDSTVSLALSALLTPLTQPTNGHDPASIGLEDVAKSFLGNDVPFFQFYSDFLALYESISFSHAPFAQLLLPPLAMSYPVDYRKLLWTEQSTALRAIHTKIDEVPLELGSISVFLVPGERDPDVLAGYTRALIRGWVTETMTEFLFRVATHHLADLFWGTVEKGDGLDSLRVSLLVALLASANDAVLRRLLELDLHRSSELCVVDDEEQGARMGIVAMLAGPKAFHRITSL